MTMKRCIPRPVVIILLAGMLCSGISDNCCRKARADTYLPYTPITDVSIANPVPNEVWLAGSDHTLTCTTSTDTDCNATTEELESDSVTHYWTGTGTFKDNDNVGTSVTYICTNTACTNTVTVYANDNYAPESNSALFDETAKTDTENVTVVVPQLEWVEYGGTAKHTLYKKDAAEWNPSNEDYATNYTTAVPARAWVRSPSLEDPICYTKNATGSQVTAEINFTTSAALTESSTVEVGANDGSADTFTDNSVTVSGSSTTAGPMNLDSSLPNSVGGVTWSNMWSYRDPSGSNTWIEIGQSDNVRYDTWGTPSGSTVTAIRMNWAAYLKCNNDATITALGDSLSAGVNSDTNFGGDNPSNRWEALDGSQTNDCLGASILAEKALLLLGVSSSDCGTQVSYPSSDSTGDPDYPSDVTDKEYSGGYDLDYTNNDGSSWNNYEGSFRAEDGSTWKYWTVFALDGPFTGTGADATEKDKSARYNILDDIRDGAGANFYQKYDEFDPGAPKVPLP